MNYTESAPVQIGSDVWIGMRAIIADGVSIGHGAIIGANTVVTKDIPPYAIFYGSPPKIHSYRFEPNVIEALIASEWWLAPPHKIDVESLLKLIDGG